MAVDVQEIFRKARERAAQTQGTFQPDADGRKVGDTFGGVVVEYSEMNHPEFGHAPGTLLRPLADEHKVPDPANPKKMADLTNVLWLGQVLKSAYYRLLPEPGDIVVGVCTGQRESRSRTNAKYWDWNVIVYDGETGNPKLPASMRGLRPVDPESGQVYGPPTQRERPAFTEDDETIPAE